MIDFLGKIKQHYQQNPKRFWIIVACVIVALLLLRILVNALSNQKKGPPPIPVALASAKTKDVPVYFSAIGTVTSDATITLKTQINGILQHVYFDDGQMVKAGQVLAQIDPRPYQAQLEQYEGALIRDTALLKNAQIDLTRYKNLYKTYAVSQQTLATQKSLVKQDMGAVKIDQGQIDAVKTNLIYCKITSPVDGQIGLSIVDQGNFVQTTDTAGIAVITTISPIEVYFPLPEDDLPAVAKQFYAKKTLEVDVYNRDGSQLLTTGVLGAIDSSINASTGTIQLEGVFQNKHHELFPNQFVNIKLKITTLQNALIVPTTAIQQGANGSYVYRYNANHTVSNVPVKTGVTEGENTVVKSGLNVNQLVVTAGTDKLYEGAKVIVNNGA